jgi:hypothetical protein
LREQHGFLPTSGEPIGLRHQSNPPIVLHCRF